MLRVIHQQEANQRAWQAFLAGAAKKNEPWDAYARRVNVEARTPEDKTITQLEAARTVQAVKRRLGRIYRPPSIAA